MRRLAAFRLLLPSPRRDSASSAAALRRPLAWTIAYVVVGWLASVLVVGAAAQETKDPAKERPRVAVAAPLAIGKGAAAPVTLRGWKLEQATEVHVTNPRVTVKLGQKGQAPVPNGQDAKQIGDTKLDVELTVPADVTDEELTLFVRSPAGESQAYSLLVRGRDEQIVEQEPNDGFESAQSIVVPQTIDGQIGADRDVDVYAVTVEAGRRLSIELVARRRGSALDGFLTVYDERGRTVASNDDAPAVAADQAPAANAAPADSQLTFTAPRAGKYRIVVQDAFDHGGPAHPYRLIVRQAKE